MNQYIVTFYSHFGATRYKKYCIERGANAKAMPVPRALSSSCGTCVSYNSDNYLFEDKYIDEIEKIVKVTTNGYEIVYSSED